MKKILTALFITSCLTITAINAAPAPITDLTTANAEGLLSTKKYVVVKVYADWCGPCKTLNPTYEAVANELSSQYTFTSLNADSDKQLITKYNVQGLPTILFFKDGKEVGRNVGNISQSALKDRITTTFAK